MGFKGVLSMIVRKAEEGEGIGIGVWGHWKRGWECGRGGEFFQQLIENEKQIWTVRLVWQRIFFS